jgi:hypothetical protein
MAVDSMTDPYDLANLRLPPEAEQRVTPGKVRERREQFVMVPQWWVERLVKARRISTYRVALHVLYRHWKSRGQAFPLPNEAVFDGDINRWRKWDGLRELEQLGLVTVERRRRKSPIVTCRMAREP